MTELEILKRARLYIESLANGVNPLTDKPVAESDCVNNIRISRCLFYVSEVLEKVIRKGGPDGIKQKKLPFSITKEELEGYSLSEAPITISDMAAKISALKQSDVMRKIWYSDIASFFQAGGYLKEEDPAMGKKAKIPTEKGYEIGIIREDRLSSRGRQYTVNLLTAKAQQFVLDNMNSIIESIR